MIAPEGSTHVRTVLPLRPREGEDLAGPRRQARRLPAADTQVVCTDVYGSGVPVAGACCSRTAVTR